MHIVYVLSISYWKKTQMPVRMDDDFLRKCLFLLKLWVLYNNYTKYYVIYKILCYKDFVRILHIIEMFKVYARRFIVVVLMG